MQQCFVFKKFGSELLSFRRNFSAPGQIRGAERKKTKTNDIQIVLSFMFYGRAKFNLRVLAFAAPGIRNNHFFLLMMMTRHPEEFLHVQAVPRSGVENCGKLRAGCFVSVNTNLNSKQAVFSRVFNKPSRCFLM